MPSTLPHHAPPPAGIRSRDRAVLALIPALPVLSGLAMLDPDRHTLMGLASTAFALIAPAMVLAWPEARRAIWPGGRLAALALVVLLYGVVLAIGVAALPRLSLTLLALWAAAMLAGRAVQLRARTGGDPFIRAVSIAILLAGPLYVPLLPLMDLIHGADGGIDWGHDMPGFRHVRKMGHLLTASAAAGIGLVLIAPAAGRGGRGDAALTALALFALALAIWSGARGAWLTLALATPLLWLTARAAGAPVRGARLGLVFAGSLALALVLPVPGLHLGVVAELVSSAERMGDMDQLSSSRLDMWSRTLSGALAAPLTGHGWGQVVLIAPTTATLHAHSLPPELAYAFGFPVGLLALGVLLALWLEAHRRIVRGSFTLLPALAVLDTMALYALVSGTYFYGVPVILTGIVWGLCLSPEPRRK